jgi:hypothetical protein
MATLRTVDVWSIRNVGAVDLVRKEIRHPQADEVTPGAPVQTGL